MTLLNRQNTIQNIGEYILDDWQDSWQLGNSVIFRISKNYFQHSSFESGDIYSMLALCSDQDLQEFLEDFAY